MTAPVHMLEAFKGTCIERGIHTWSLRQIRGGSNPDRTVESWRELPMSHIEDLQHKRDWRHEPLI